MTARNRVILISLLILNAIVLFSQIWPKRSASFRENSEHRISCWKPDFSSGRNAPKSIESRGVERASASHVVGPERGNS